MMSLSAITAPQNSEGLDQNGRHDSVTCTLIAKDLVYRCQFQEMLSRCSRTTADCKSERDYVDLQMLYATALVETGLGEEAKQHLMQLSATHKFQSRAIYNYTMAKIGYILCNYEESLRLFETLEHIDCDASLKFRGLLGVANVLYSTERSAQLPAVLAKLDQLKNSVPAEDQISHLILLGNHYRTSGRDIIMASKYFSKALERASVHAWTYFMQRAVYGLACVAQSEQQHDELKTLRVLLNAMTEGTQSTHFKNLVKTKFTKPESQNALFTDASRMNVKFGEVQVNLSDRPLLFIFIKTLNERSDFVTKQVMAKLLWPSEAYLPHTHDPRIFDIAKRVRKLLESQSQQKLNLLSNRLGYRLVSA